MKYTEAGTYYVTLKAVDSCGNESTYDREIIVEEPETFNTTLFADGTLIINESSRDRAANEAAHGSVVQEYVPLDENNTYVFSGREDQPWANEQSQLTAVEFGSLVAPVSLEYWFQNTMLETIDFTNFDGSNVTSVRALAASTQIGSLTLPSMPNLTNIRYICNKCLNLTSVDFSQVGATAIVNTSFAFQGCYALTEVSLVGLGGMVDSCDFMFANINNDGMGDMQITTIYSDGTLEFGQASSSANMFRTCTSLVGGDGTVFRSDVTNKGYARIDNLPDEPGYFTRG